MGRFRVIEYMIQLFLRLRGLDEAKKYLTATICLISYNKG